jgi:hypothetical protein
MSDNNDILGTTGRSRLGADVMLLMLKGSGYALVLCLAIWLVAAVIIGIGRALPEDSRFTPDPNQQGSVFMTPADVAYV